MQQLIDRRHPFRHTFPLEDGAIDRLTAPSEGSGQSSNIDQFLRPGGERLRSSTFWVSIKIDPDGCLGMCPLPVVTCQQLIAYAWIHLVALDDHGAPGLQVARACRQAHHLEDALNLLPWNRLPCLKPANAPPFANGF